MAGKPQNGFDLKQLRQISEWMHSAGIQEVQINDERGNLHVKRYGTEVTPPLLPPVPQMPQGFVPSDNMGSAPEPVEAPVLSGHVEKSPMVGVAYLAASPTDPPFVEVGSRVESGDVLMIIEAMKVMNRIEASQSGHVKRVLVENGEAVEFDQPLVEIE